MKKIIVALTLIAGISAITADVAFAKKESIVRRALGSAAESAASHIGGALATAAFSML